MPLFPARHLVAWSLAVAAAATGCATSPASRAGQARVDRRAALVSERQPPTADLAPQQASQAYAAPQPVQLAAFEQDDTTGQAPAVPVVRGSPDPAHASPPTADRPTIPLDFSSALSLAQGQNPRVAFAQAQIAQSQAVYEAARALWLPSLRAGGNYNKHEGRIQDVVGTNIETSRGAAYGGLGASAVGAGSPAVPGVYAFFHTADAIYQRQITGYALDAREFQATAVTNDQLLETALAYLELLAATQRQAIADETLAHGQALVELTASFVRAGAGSQADADRAVAAAALLKTEAVRTVEGVAVASARLAQLLSLDPTVQIAPQEATIAPIELVSLDLSDADLVATGLSNRPELAASRSLVCEAVNRLRREEHAPWLPSVLLGVSYGGFGAGLGGQITRGGDRFDFDGAAWWEVRNLGFGERAARDNARAQIQLARLREVEALDTVAREIVEAHLQSRARQRQIAVAQDGIAAAQQSYERNLDRIQNGQGLPIEVLQAIHALDAARREYLRALADYNTAQFRLHRALGWPIAL